MTGPAERRRDDEPRIVLSARAIRKAYPGTVALKGVDFDIHHAKVNVLIGENGAGKSTLMKILAGIEQPTSGTLHYRGEALHLSHPREAIKRGIGIVHQELNLCANLNVAENIFIGKELKGPGGTVRLARQRRIATEVLTRMGQRIDVDALVQELSIGERQIVEIAKVLVSEVDILILDEPTSSLSKAEVGVLFSLIEELKRQGVSIVYISHRLEELIEIGDTFTVLRDGNLAGTGVAGEVTVDWLVTRMIGAQMEGQLRDGRAAATFAERPVALRVEGLEASGVNGGLALKQLSFSIKRGEIVGFYGLMGAGRTELFETLIGLRRALAGTIEIEGRRLPLDGSIAGRIRAGIALVPEDRQKLGLVPNRSVADNLLLANLERYASLTGLRSGRMRRDVSRCIDELMIKVSDPEVLVSTLSGGNQQKAVLGKNLLTEPKILLLDEPTRGIDIKARRELFEVIDRLADSGLTILYASSDLGEIISGADRVLVMSQGRITADLQREELTEARLVASSQVQRRDTRKESA